MNVTGVRVEIIKRISDGDYGFEQFNAQYVAELEDGEDPDAAIRELSLRGRAEVIGQLKESESSGVRYRLEAPREIDHGEFDCPDCGVVVTGGGLCDACADDPDDDEDDRDEAHA